MDLYELISISLYFILMVAIGFYAYKKSTANTEEFLLGGRKMGAAVTALSAGSADMSGWLLMGLPGAMYISGLSASWIAIGLTLGAYLNYLYIAPRLRIYTELAGNSITLPVFFENRFQDQSRLLRVISSVLILIFFTLYTSAGMVSGGRLFEFAFGMHYNVGLCLTSLVVVVYTFLGGFLAVSLTDFVQGTIMVLALVTVPIVAVVILGGPMDTLEIIENKNNTYLSLFTGTTKVSVLSLLCWGLGYCGQPHILVRFMAIDSVKDLIKARRIGISWMIFTVGGALLVGLIGIAYLHKYDIDSMMIFDSSKEKAETIFIYFARVLFHPLISGFLLSAILAAVMSTISSQLLVTSSSITEDVYKAFINKKPTEKQAMIVSRLSVLGVAIIAFILSLTPRDSILNLVGNAWAGFGATFGPLIILSLFWKRTNAWGALAGMLTGGISVLVWVYAGLYDKTGIYEIIPSFFLSLVMIIIISLCTEKPKKEIIDTYDKMDVELEEKYKN
ncbi:sodium/proline symporter PutP [Apibacter muscae]|uniref:sodium/proline symporter PutP n=1 Tax=Apibacter muscae TaxID=2509004 RepID=UPI0011ABD4CF|nr:sodium/proline symporter PutP [Apibacter muscae]TWP23806.1 sodium/proline symporter PutP [Apibacter muscae]